MTTWLQPRTARDLTGRHTRSQLALTLAQTDDAAAIHLLRHPTGSIPSWQTAMASVVLAACQPDRCTVADNRALRTVMLLEGKQPHLISSTCHFPRSRWDGCLRTCRELHRPLRVLLQILDRVEDCLPAAGRVATGPGR